MDDGFERIRKELKSMYNTSGYDRKEKKLGMDSNDDIKVWGGWSRIPSG